MKKITLTLAMVALATLGGSNLCAQINGSAEKFDFTKATNYYLIYLDGETAAVNIPANKIKKDYRTDDVTHFLYIWDDTYTANTAVGPNSNDVAGEYLDFSVASVGWSGFGFAGLAPGKDMSGVDNTYYLHFAMKAADASAHASHQVIISEDAPGANYAGKIVIGSKPFIDAGVTFDPIGDFTRDGEWYNFDIPLKSIQGCSFANKTEMVGNVFSMISGGVAGTNICLDAVFFYQKSGGSAIESTEVDVNQIVVSNGMITVNDNNDIKLFDISGKLVKSSVESMNISDLNGGIYVVKSGDAVKKIAIK